MPAPDKSDSILTYLFFLQFKSNAEFVITSTEPALCTNAPTTGSSTPVIASTIATKLSVSENVRLSFIVPIIRFASAVRCGSSRISSLTRAMSAASTAMSLPTPPIAMPTVAHLSAGASFIPSPIMHTPCPALSRSFM